MGHRSNALFGYHISKVPRKMEKALNQLSFCASVSSPTCANEQPQILSSGMFFDCNVNVTINKKEKCKSDQYCSKLMTINGNIEIFAFLLLF